MSRGVRKFLIAASLGAVAIFTACGGSAGSSAAAPSARASNSAPLTITTDPILPATLQGHAYSTALQVVGGQGALHWSISPVGPTALFVNGLSIDVATGSLSGTANFAGTAGLLAQVTDSSSPPQSTSKAFTVTAYSALVANPSGTATLLQFENATVAAASGIQGGVPPLNFAVSGGLPRSMKLNTQTGQISGVPLDTGTFPFVLSAQDSFSPAEVATQPFTITVNPHNLVVMALSLPSRMPLNRVFTGKVIATGGIPPYSFAQGSGTLPPGIGLDPATGAVSGTPTSAGTYIFTINATDSSLPANNAAGAFVVTVAPALGRNDTPATATPISNGAVDATISPYIDPPNGTPVAGDSDFYKVVSLGGATVHVETLAKTNFPDNPLDTVLQITDGNGRQLATCRQPGDTSTNFTSPCVNDDISSTPHVQDSALDFQVPGPANIPTAFYVQVLDWRGDARPDMGYSLRVSGAVAPLTVTTAALLPGANGLSYSQQLTAGNGTGPISWSLAGGALPPGLTLGPTGAISGAATLNGVFTFTVQASDSASPPQTTTAQETIQVVDPVKIISAPIFPNACLNQPYTFAVQTSGGIQPVVFGFVGITAWPAINISQSGVFSGTPQITGTFTGRLSAVDATGHGDAQQISLSVTQCP